VPAAPASIGPSGLVLLELIRSALRAGSEVVYSFVLRLLRRLRRFSHPMTQGSHKTTVRGKPLTSHYTTASLHMHKGIGIRLRYSLATASS